MYNFRDITNHSAISNPLPAEAVAIDGQYIETVIDGYRTLYTKGRESLGVDVSTYSVANANGERLKGTRYPARKLTVGFMLVAESNADFRAKFTKLNNLLSMQVADFIFNDEPDKFFTGTPIMDAEVNAGSNSVKGEWHIYCAYPFKRSVEVTHLTMEDAVISNNTASFGIDYKGTVPAKPVLRAKFAPSDGTSYTADGDCGFVAFLDEDANVIQLGNPSMIAYDGQYASVAIINQNFNSISGWQTSGGAPPSVISGTMTTGEITDPEWNEGEGQTLTYAIPQFDESERMQRGCELWKTITQNDVKDFDLKLVHRFCADEITNWGSFGLYLQDANDDTVAGFSFVQKPNSTNTEINFIVKGLTDSATPSTQMIIRGDYYSKYGYTEKTDVYTNTGTRKERVKTADGYETRTVRTCVRNVTYRQAEPYTRITKKGNDIAFSVGGRETWRYKTNDRSAIKRITMYFGVIEFNPPHTNAVRSICLSKITGEKFSDIPNVFFAGDIVEADCNDASVTLFRDGTVSGYSAPEYGALGNNWEDFELTAGVNAIQVAWSDWVDPNYKPEIEIDYNEVFI